MQQKRTLFSAGILFYILLLFPTYNCSKNPAGPEYSGSDRILFIKSNNEFSAICSICPDGSDEKVIAKYVYKSDFDFQGYYAARWSDDRSLLVVGGGPGSTRDYHPLWLMDKDGNLIQKLTEIGWSAKWLDDNTILFHRDRGWGSIITDIYTVSITGENEQMIYRSDDSTHFGCEDIYKDKIHLLCTERKYYTDNDGETWLTDSEASILNIYTSEKQYITDNDRQDSYCRLSPDESKIVYMSQYFNSKGEFIRNLYLMTTEGDSLKQITNNKEQITTAFMNPQWSPDGTKVAYYSAKQSEAADIFITDVNTGKTRTLIGDGSTGKYAIMDWK